MLESNFIVYLYQLSVIRFLQGGLNPARCCYRHLCSSVTNQHILKCQLKIWLAKLEMEMCPVPVPGPSWTNAHISLDDTVTFINLLICADILEPFSYSRARACTETS